MALIKKLNNNQKGNVGETPYEFQFIKENGILLICIAVSMMILRYFYPIQIQYTWAVFSVLFSIGTVLFALYFKHWREELRKIERSIDRKKEPFPISLIMFGLSGVYYVILTQIVNKAALRPQVYLVALLGMGAMWAITNIQEIVTGDKLEDSRSYDIGKVGLIGVIKAVGTIIIAIFVNVAVVILLT